MAVVLDAQLRNAALAASNVIYGGQRANRAALTAPDVFNATVIRDAVETLETNNAPKFEGDYYVCFLHPHQARALRNDAAWVNASLYAGAQQIFRGEIGRFEDVRFVSTTVMPNGANAAVDPTTGDYVDLGFNTALSVAGGAPVPVYQALFFGEYAYGHATGLPAELRDNGVQDFGREHGLAWYAIWGQNLLDNANIVVAETA
jgi:N4-gp56 family major capsid protein